MAEAHRRRIPSYALAETVGLAAGQGLPTIEHGVASPFALDGLGLSGEIFSPGAGHTADNATVWLSETRVLVGGCLVRAQESATIGNTTEADLESWPRSIVALQRRYPEIRVVVPGHGAPGGSGLLAHTRALLER